MKVRYSYLPQQFSDCDDLWSELKNFVKTGDFTLGAPLQKFEANFSKLMGVKHALGVNSGTDAIKLSLKAKGVSFGSAFKFEYKLLIPYKDKKIKVRFDDWIFKQDDKTAINKATLTKFGFKVGELIVFFVKD